METSVDRMSSEQHGYGHLLQVDLPRGTWYAVHLLSHMLISAPSMFGGNSHPPGLLDAEHWPEIRPWLCLGLLHLDDYEFSWQVVTRLSGSQDRTSAMLSSAQVKDLVLDNMVITPGARQIVEWLSTLARRLRPLPLKALTAHPCLLASACL